MEFCHLDLKPENVLIKTLALDEKNQQIDGRRIEASDIRLCDFGLTAVSGNYNPDSELDIFGLTKCTTKCGGDDDELAEEDDIIRAGQACGTPGFFAPEMVIQGAFEGRTADMWSVGCILLEISFGYPRLWMDSYDYFNRDVKQFKDGLLLCLEEIQCFYDMDTEEEFLIHDLLLKYMLHMDVDKRATAAQVLKHPWFQYSHDQIINKRRTKTDDDSLPSWSSTLSPFDSRRSSCGHLCWV
jgi:serine/threonine protein kinase